MPARKGLVILPFISVMKSNEKNRNIEHRFPAGIYLLTVNHRNTKTRCEIC